MNNYSAKLHTRCKIKTSARREFVSLFLLDVDITKGGSSKAKAAYPTRKSAMEGMDAGSGRARALR